MLSSRIRPGVVVVSAVSLLLLLAPDAPCSACTPPRGAFCNWDAARSRLSLSPRGSGGDCHSSARCLRAAGGQDDGRNLFYPEPRTGINWAELGFGLTTKDTFMAVARCKRGAQWEEYSLEPYGPLQLEPAATALNYGQSIFEGMKAYRTAKGRIVLFRPQINARRLAEGAERLMMPPVPEAFFLEMVAALVRSNADWVPPAGSGALYMRPLLFGSGPGLGVGPSSEYTLVVYAAPVGEYFKAAAGGGAHMRLESDHQRAATRGVGNVKFAGNYAPCFLPQSQARADGFSDIIYLDESGRWIEEAAASNFFCVGQDRILRTPTLGTILPGVTRESVLHLARRLIDAKDTGPGALLGVEECQVSAQDALSSAEVFVTGTGAGLTPVRRLVCGDQEAEFECPGPATQRLRDALTGLQLEQHEDELGWLWDPFKTQCTQGSSLIEE
eukprot:TRINITY_DN34016_c0_g1_i1.p1 TRINITY_DN34016_c0_g1~~TRINITY_DN34016_c0_g1_i1.p1  ORF type:complete len:443 (+),score=68.97 TRINITY_DN34016_c0_g1_i1:116-1444(+)